MFKLPASGCLWRRLPPGETWFAPIRENKMKITVVLLIPVIICFGIFLMPDSLGAEDTGTYEIQKYDAVLMPHSNGEVEISYMQKWLVTGGDIPWVTVGLPNPDFYVQNFSGAAKSVEQANQGDWYGVRIDLDRDYQPQETFQINFTIIQRGLLERTDNGYRLVYTPGWYDRAFTDALTVKLVSPVKVTDLTTDPQPNSVNGQELVWTRTNFGKGERFTVSIDFPVTLIDKSAQGPGIPPLPPPPLSPPVTGGGIAKWIPVAVFVMIGLAILLALNTKEDYKKDGSTYTSPEIYSGSPIRNRRIGGGFRSCISCACACACVSCACACACAGGGGAGCKKPHHSCPICSPKSMIKGSDNNEFP